MNKMEPEANGFCSMTPEKDDQHQDCVEDSLPECDKMISVYSGERSNIESSSSSLSVLSESNQAFSSPENKNSLEPSGTSKSSEPKPVIRQTLDNEFIDSNLKVKNQATDRKTCVGVRPKSASCIPRKTSSAVSSGSRGTEHSSRQKNSNHSNASSGSTHPCKPFYTRKNPSSSFLFNLHAGKRPHNFTLDKAARPFTKSSKLYKPLSASLKSKQALLSHMLPSAVMNLEGDLRSKPLEISIEDTHIDITQYNNCLLPIPILTHIFSYLSLYDLLCRTTRVCRYWYTAVYDPALWRYVNLSEQYKIDDEILLKLTNISDNVLGIDISTRRGSLQVFPQTIDTCLKSNVNLKYFSMARCFDMPAEIFLSVGLLCPNLVYLDLDICSNITNEAIINVGKGCPKLKALYLGQCNLVKNTGIVQVARGCPHLQQLRIEQCDKITDQPIIELTKYCPDIDYLHMLSCSLTDSSICQLIKLPKLKMLDISNITQLSPKVLTQVIENCRELEILNISLNRAVNDDCIKIIVQTCDKLRILSCVACRLTDKALEYVADYGKHIEHLDVAWCVDITNSGVKYISDHNPALKYLGLMQCRKVTFDAIDDLIEAHPDIHYSNFVTESRRILKKACVNVDNEFQTL